MGEHQHTLTINSHRDFFIQNDNKTMAQSRMRRIKAKCPFRQIDLSTEQKNVKGRSSQKRFIHRRISHRATPQIKESRQYPSGN